MVFDAQARCLAYMEWAFEIFCAVRKDYEADCVADSAEPPGILHDLQVPDCAEQFDYDPDAKAASSCSGSFVKWSA